MADESPSCAKQYDSNPAIAALEFELDRLRERKRWNLTAFDQRQADIRLLEKEMLEDEERRYAMTKAILRLRGA